MPSLADILKINPLGERFCIAYSFSPQLVCRCRIGSTSLIGLLLEEGSWRLAQCHTVEPVLRQLAPLLLCRAHHFLISEYVTWWIGEICEFQAGQRERQLEGERERERQRQRHGDLQRRLLSPSSFTTSSPSSSSSSISSPSSASTSTATVPLGYQPHPNRSLRGHSTFNTSTSEFTSTTDSIPNSNHPSTSTPTISPPSTGEMSLNPPTQAVTINPQGELGDFYPYSPNPFAPLPPQHSMMLPTRLAYANLPTPSSTNSPLPPATTINTKSLCPHQKQVKKVFRRSIEGECGICILPFSVDPDDGSFVGCVARDVGEIHVDEESEIFSSDEEDGDAGDEMLVDGLTDYEDCDDEEENGGDGEDTEELSDIENEDEDEDEDDDENDGEREDKSDPIVWCKVQCGTNYHRSCLETWIETFKNEAYRRPTCPTCRALWKD